MNEFRHAARKNVLIGYEWIKFAPMQLFYSDRIDSDQINLDQEESRHLKVLRKQVGDEIMVTDGGGRLYTCVLESLGKNPLLRIDSVQEYPSLNPQIHLIVAPTKSVDRIEWMLEKCVEIGIHELSFILCERSERKIIKLERLRKKAVSAMKQSKQFHLPKINEIEKLGPVLGSIPADAQKWMGHCEEESDKARPRSMRGDKHVLLIGPEGDFSKTEIEIAKQAGFKSIDLGPTILRTETAAVVGCALLRNGMQLG